MVNNLRYRAEIDGLRAVAVIPVILFYADAYLLPGGFVGVDIFFVISGFLITSILARDLEAGEFSLFKFYERRARRILPALFFVLAATSVVAAFIMLPYELKTYGQRLVAVIFFVSNIVFWRQSGYFAEAAELNPLLHTWSLAVEEQFYIFFPLILFFLWRWKRMSVFLILAALTLFSLSLADFFSTRRADANFYLLPTRAWELGVGALLAMWLLHREQPKGTFAEFLGFAGLAAIAASIYFYGPGTPFPSRWALLPVLGAACVILAASPNTIVGKVLSWRPVVFLGLLSYSAYLWHQPLLAFARILHPDNQPPLLIMLSLATLSVLLAWGTWVVIEKPFRQQGRPSRAAIFWTAGTGSAALAGIGLMFIATGGLLHRYPEPFQKLLADSNLEYSRYVTGGYSAVHNAPLTGSKEKLVLVGDSFSQDFYNIIYEAGWLDRFSVSAIYIPTRCQIYYGSSFEEVKENIAPKDRIMCSKKIMSEQNIEVTRKADILIFSSSWKKWSAQIISDTIEAMNIRNETNIFVIGTKKFKGRQDLLEIAGNPKLKAIFNLPENVKEVNEILRRNAFQYTFVDLMSFLCEDQCPLVTPQGEMISYDGSHLTRHGAVFLSETVLPKTPLAKLAEQLEHP